MGFPNSEHIKKFVKGQTIKDVVSDARKAHFLLFESGEKLRFYPHLDEIICTPYAEDGEIKQSLEIMKSGEQSTEQVTTTGEGNAICPRCGDQSKVLHFECEICEKATSDLPTEVSK